ncbi:MAG: LPS export ABC transporter periplasmic protein LptC [Thermodesulfobacteriota bacterium]
MQRSHVRRALIVGVMLALASLGFVLGRTLVSQQSAATPPQPDLEPDVSQRIKEFRRVKVKDGRKVWELTAQEAEYFADKGEVVVEGPKLAFYAGDGRNIEVTGHQGKIQLAGGDVKQIELDGGIDVTVGEYFVQTDRAIYFESLNAIVAPGDVSLKSSELTLAGQTMVLELATQRVRFVKGVTTTFQGAGGGGPDGDIQPPVAARPQPAARRAAAAAS